MVCRISCSISLVFLIGMIYMTNATSNNHIVQNYKKKIPDHLKSLYQDIVEERKQIYYTGYGLGLAIAILFILFNIKVLNKSFSTISMVCMTTTIAFVVNYFYYILSPKKAYMLDHIETPEQTQAWLQMYKTMQYHYHMGLVIGMIAVAVFSYGWCRK
jgi:hypothetical protein